MCLMICSWNQNKREATTTTPQEPWTVHTNDLHPVESINRVGGMGAFCSGELDPIYLAKMATMRVEQQRNKVLTSQLNNWSTNPYHSRPKISEPITVVWQQSDLSCNTRASSFVPLRTWVLNLFQDRSKRWTIHPCQMCLMICSWNQNKREATTTTPQEPWTVHTNDLHPVESINRVGGMGAFCSGELDPIYLAKMATMRVEQQRNKVLTSQLNNWSTNPYHSRPKISEPITVVWQQSDLSCNTRASSFVPLRTWVLNLFQDRSKRWTIHPCQMCLMICSWNQNKREATTTTPQEPWTVHTNDLHPRCQIGNLLSTVHQPSLTPTSIRSLDGGSAGLASVEMRSMYRLTFTSRANFQKDPTSSHKSSRAE